MSYDVRQITKFSKEEIQNGEKFELEVIEEIKRLHPEAKILHNIIIPKKDGKTTEIDVVLLSKKGFYVLECKAYNGLVVGNPTSKNWTIFYFKKFKKTFYSPIFQNRGHIFALRNMFPKYFFNNLVIFSNNSRMSKEIFKAKEVKNLKGFTWLLENVISKKKDVYTEAEVLSVYNYLAPFKNGDREAHIEYVRKIQESVQ